MFDVVGMNRIQELEFNRKITRLLILNPPPLKEKSGQFFLALFYYFQKISKCFGRSFIIFKIWPNLWADFHSFWTSFLSVSPLVTPQKVQKFSRASRAFFLVLFYFLQKISNFFGRSFIFYKKSPNVFGRSFSYGGFFNINTLVVL